MGLPNSDMFLSEQDLKSLEFNFFSRPMLELQEESQTTPSEEVDFNNEQQGTLQDDVEKEEKCEVLVSSLKIKLPSYGEVKLDDEECKTPTSPDHKVQVIFPPAPRKPKTLPSTKRKGSSRRMFLDLSKEIEALFPPPLLADLGGKIKKVRRASSFI